MGGSEAQKPSTGFLSSLPKLLLLALVGWVIFSVATCSSRAPSAAAGTNAGKTPAAELARMKAEKAAEDKAEREKCEAVRSGGYVEYRALMAKKRFWDASLTINRCVDLIDDSELKGLHADAEIKSFIADINNPKLSPGDRGLAAEKLVRHYPDAGKPYEKHAAKFYADAERQSKAAAAARRRSEGVLIGMTKEEALASSWGKPRKINRTTNAYGTSEQWVYDGGYLYFDGDRLTSIQN